MKGAALLALLALFPVSAVAAEIDPRIAPQMVAALQSLVALRDAQIQGLLEDQRKREAEWAEYSKPLWQPGEK